MDDTRLKNEKKRKWEKIAEEKRYDAIMKDAMKALDKDGSVRKELPDEIEFVRVEHTTPDERNLVLYVNKKFVH